jgi:DNA-directed RNA polymerase subunit H
MSAKVEKIEHELIPEHSKLSEKEAKDILKKYHVTIREMPKIIVSDPAISHLDVKEGDVIKIKRNSRTAGEMTFFRAVVKE